MITHEQIKRRVRQPVIAHKPTRDEINKALDKLKGLPYAYEDRQHQMFLFRRRFPRFLHRFLPDEFRKKLEFSRSLGKQPIKALANYDAAEAAFARLCEEASEIRITRPQDPRLEGLGKQWFEEEFPAHDRIAQKRWELGCAEHGYDPADPCPDLRYLEYDAEVRDRVQSWLVYMNISLNDDEVEQVEMAAWEEYVFTFPCNMPAQGEPPVASTQPPPPLSDDSHECYETIFERFLSSRSDKKQEYKTAFKHLSAALGPSRRISMIYSTDVEKLDQRLRLSRSQRGERLTKKVANRYRNRIRAFYDWAFEQNLVRTNPFRRLRSRFGHTAPESNLTLSSQNVRGCPPGSDYLWPKLDGFREYRHYRPSVCPRFRTIKSRQCSEGSAHHGHHRSGLPLPASVLLVIFGKPMRDHRG